MPKTRMAWVAIAPLLCANSIAVAETTSAQLDDAKNAAALAQALTTASTAQATAEAALAASRLANTKAEITNVQSALAGPKASDLKTVSSLTAPTVNARFYALLVEDIDHWLADGTSKNPVTQLSGCSAVFIDRPSLATVAETYKSVEAKLDALAGDLNYAADTLSRHIEEIEPPPEKKETKLYFAPAVLPGITAAVGLASLAANFTAAAKQVTAIGSQNMPKASELVVAMVAEKITDSTELKDKLYDTDLAGAMDYGKLGTAQCGSDNTLASKADCVAKALDKAKDTLSRATNEKLKDEAKALSATITQSAAALNALFVLDSAGAIPFNRALQGQALYAKMVDKDACVLSLKSITSDADAIVRDGTFTSYKLSIETTTTVSWTIASPSGAIRKVGFKALATNWKRQDLDQ